MSEEMDIGVLLAEQVGNLLAKSVTRETWEAAEGGDIPGDLWQKLVELDLKFALVPESVGGAGLNWIDLAEVFRTFGYRAAPVPELETMVAAWALASSGIEDIPEGALSVATAIMELDEEGMLNGEDSLVAWAGQTEYTVVVAHRSGESLVCLVKSSDLTLAPLQTTGRIPSAAIHLEKVRPVAAQANSALDGLGLLPHMACVRALQMSGALDRMLELCVEYGNTRTQFGRTIGKFQAVQHMVAELAAQAAAAQVACIYACRRIDNGDAAQGASVAKTQVGHAAGAAAAIAHQVFGAIGVTDEHELHYYTRRLWQWRTEAGSEHWWSERLGREVLASGGAELWAGITGRKSGT